VGAFSINPAACGVTEIASTPLTLAEPATLFASGQGELRQNSGTGGVSGILVMQLFDASDTLVAQHRGAEQSVEVGESHPVLVSGVLKDLSSSATYTAAPGSYTLRLRIAMFGACSATQSLEDVSLDVITSGVA
jgi:hypothetical protein